MLSFLVVPLVLCAAVLLVSGVAKLRDTRATRDAFVALRLPRWLSDSAPALLPWGELALGVALLVSSGWVLLLAALATLGLFFGYLAVIARALGFTERVTCNCFGRLGEQGVTRRTLVRNAVLVATATLATVAALARVSVPGTIMDAPGATLGWLAMAALAGAGALFVLGHGPAQALSAGSRPRSGSRLPWLTMLDATTRTPVPLWDLPTERTVLLFVSLSCGSCARVLADLPTLRAEHPDVAIRPVLSETHAGDPAAWEPASMRSEALLDPHGNITNMLVEWTPTALLVDRNGELLSDPAVGEGEVRALIASTSAEPVVPEPEPGHATEPEPEPESVPVEEPDDDEFAYERKPIPTAVLLDADGRPRTLHELTAQTAALLVSINCLCGTSRQAAGSVARWRELLPQLEVRLLTSVHPDSLPEDLRPEGAVAYDHVGLVQSALDLSGSPSAVLLGADGLLAGGPVHGLEEIEAFVTDIADQLADA